MCVRLGGRDAQEHGQTKQNKHPRALSLLMAAPPRARVLRNESVAYENFGRSGSGASPPPLPTTKFCIVRAFPNMASRVLMTVLAHVLRL